MCRVRRVENESEKKSSLLQWLTIRWTTMSQHVIQPDKESANKSVRAGSGLLHLRDDREGKWSVRSGICSSTGSSRWGIEKMLDRERFGQGERGRRDSVLLIIKATGDNCRVVGPTLWLHVFPPRPSRCWSQQASLFFVFTLPPWDCASSDLY